MIFPPNPSPQYLSSSEQVSALKHSLLVKSFLSDK